MAMTRLCEAFNIPRGITAFVGGGGKTSLIDRLAHELSADSRVLRLTTTRIYPPRDGLLLISPTEKSLNEAFKRSRIVTVGEHAENGKLRAPDCDIVKLSEAADYTLIEADGSRGLPMKAPNDSEPVLTGVEKLVIAVAGAQGFYKLIEIAAHRPDIYAALLGKSKAEPITPLDAAAVIESRFGQRKGVSCEFLAVINQCDDARAADAGRECANALVCKCALLSLKARPDWYELYYGR